MTHFEEDDARSSAKHRAALEALFTRNTEKTPTPPTPAVVERTAKIVTLPLRDDPRREERDKRLAKLMAAEGCAAVTKACEALLNSKLALPEEQEVMLKLLDHDRSDRVHDALTSLSRLLDTEAPQRRAVLDARLRHLEEDAEDEDIRALASSLRKKLARLVR
jgi:hypothetical protein